MADEVDKTKLSEAIMLLGKNFNSPQPKVLEKAIDLLRQSLQTGAAHSTIRYGAVPEFRDSFIAVGPKWYQQWHGGGMRPQELKLIGATPHGGKTHFLVWDGSQYILSGYRVLHINGEDLLADVKFYYSQAVRNDEALEENLLFADMQDKRFGVQDVEAVYEQAKEEGFEAEIIIIDHVDLMRGGYGKADWEAVSEIMAELKLFAKRSGTIVITATQQNFPHPDQKGMARFYRAKVGKAGEPDVIFMVDMAVGQQYTMSRVKARGRRQTTDNTKTLMCDWDSMQVEEI